ncbi:MAG: 4Fe-4S dicluster domain-containing protein [Deltaproteobacteria bacterium]|nr:4Fe-4S dicluster domain-containing protein [Deltaproteobacteria bacterium]
MTTKAFTKDIWGKTLKGLSDFYNIYAPVKEGDFFNFRRLENDQEPDFNMRNSMLSPKAVVYPQSERMFDFSIDPEVEDAHILRETPKDYSQQVIVGIRPCDAHAFRIVKPNFDNPEYRDPFWTKRYESTVFIGFACNEPCSTCFCTSVGGGPFNEEGLDAIVYDLGDRYILKGLTEKGDELIEKAEGGEPAKDSDLKEVAALAASAAEKIVSKVPTGRLKEKDVTELFNAPIWEDIAFGCINCGTCTYLCPTCWCFDIQDELLGNDGDRIRNWDSCMFPLFTLHGSGHNPRNNKYQRVRQRFMHKLKYYVDKYDSGVQCSGCGRCVRYCPANIDIREIAARMNDM